MALVEKILRGDFVDPTTLLGALSYAQVFLMLAWLGVLSLRLALLPLQRGLSDRTAATFLTQLGEIVIYVTAAILYTHLIPGLRSLGTALLTGVSVVSILLGWRHRIVSAT